LILIRYDTWDEVIKAAKDRKIDLLPAAAPAPSRLEYMLSSEKYLTFNGVIDLLPAAAPAPSRLEYMQSSGKYLTHKD